jgi:hypothetical protein
MKVKRSEDRKMLKYSMVMVFSFLSCAGEKVEEPVPLLNGTIEPDHPEFTLSADFSGYKAFAFDINDTFWMYISSNPNSNCDAVSSYLNVGGDPFDPVDVLTPGTCNMMIKVSDWQGSFTAENDPIAVAATAIECAMGEGVFELQTPSWGNRDYYWTGTWWQGNPSEYRFDISGDRDDGYSLDIEMSVYNGGFIREEMDKYEAFGTVTGAMNAYVCEGLASTGL